MVIIIIIVVIIVVVITKQKLPELLSELVLLGTLAGLGALIDSTWIMMLMKSNTVSRRFPPTKQHKHEKYSVLGIGMKAKEMKTRAEKHFNFLKNVT